MAHSIFGWSYPPGCSGPPDPPDEPHPKIEELCLLLEEAGVDQEIIDRARAILQTTLCCPECRKKEFETEQKALEQEAEWTALFETEQKAVAEWIASF